MSKEFDTAALLDALDEIGECAAAHHTRLEFNVYGGAALMLAGNFRYSTEDVDIAPLTDEWPVWLSDKVGAIAKERNWSESWLNDAVSFHLSKHATNRDHVLLGTFPRNSRSENAQVGLIVNVPSAEYMLAMKLKAMRINDPAKAATETHDILSLLSVCRVTTVDKAIDILAKFFPISAQASEKQRFVLKHIMAKEQRNRKNAPTYPARRIRADDDRGR